MREPRTVGASNKIPTFFFFIGAAIGESADNNGVMEIHCGRLIENELRNQRRSAHWLANELHCDRTNVYKIFKRKNLDVELLMHLSIILQKNFFETLTNETVTEIAKVQNM